MSVDRRIVGVAALLACLAAGCGGADPYGKGPAQTGKDKSAKAGAGDKKAKVIKPGANVQDDVQTALINAKPGDVIEFDEGTYEFTKGLSLTVNDVTIRGKGMDKTILSFKKQEEGKEGLIVNRRGFTLEDLTMQDTKGNATKITGAEDVTYRNFKAEWTGEPKASNGAYGVYPVQCTNVLVEGCVVIGASDAGIYVGQSTNVVVRKCKAMKNVAGIEIENCINADVYDNEATDNAGGLLVFDLPDLELKNGKNVYVHDNRVHGNNHKNFAAPGNMVADVAPGTGMMVMATDHVQLAKNSIEDNQTYGLMVISYLVTGRPIQDKKYDPYPEAVYAHDNTFKNNGTNPTSERAKLLAALLGTPMPEIIYDGLLNPKELVDGKMPAEKTVVFKDNKPDAISVVNLHWDQLDPKDITASKAKVERNPKSLVGEHPALPPVTLPGEKK
jgi:parallel beta-helix repeat protein